jgi:prepilin-type processing-associated H-X9-DG protein
VRAASQADRLAQFLAADEAVLKRIAPQPLRWLPPDRNSCALQGRNRHTSQTLLFGERAHGILATAWINGLLFDQYSPSRPAIENFHFWASGDHVDNMFETWNPINFYKDNVGSPSNGGRSGNGGDAIFLAAACGSFHPGGANFAFCDGSVKFLKETIDSWALNSTNTPIGITYGNGAWTVNPGARLGVYQMLSTRNGREVVGADQY